MIDRLKGMAGLAGLLRDLPRIREAMGEVTRRLAHVRAEGESGGGAVRVTATGLLQVVGIEVQPALLRSLVDPSSPGDRAVASELVVGAVNSALAAAREAAEREVAAAAAELGLPLPASGLAGLLGRSAPP
jgi:hypothetical protein